VADPVVCWPQHCQLLGCGEVVDTDFVGECSISGAGVVFGIVESPVSAIPRAWLRRRRGHYFGLLATG